MDLELTGQKHYYYFFSNFHKRPWLDLNSLWYSWKCCLLVKSVSCLNMIRGVCVRHSFHCLPLFCVENLCWCFFCALHHSESDTTTATEVSIVTRKDNPFFSPHGKKKGDEKDTDEDDKGPTVVPNVQKDDLARRRTHTGSLPQRDPRQSLAQTSITQSDLEKWQRLSMTSETRCLKNTQALKHRSHTPSEHAVLKKQQRELNSDMPLTTTTIIIIFIIIYYYKGSKKILNTKYIQSYVII